jgi:hypothetical protein
MRMRIMSKIIADVLMLIALGFVICGIMAPFAKAEQVALESRCCAYHEVRAGKSYKIITDNNGKYHFIYFGEMNK